MPRKRNGQTHWQTLRYGLESARGVRRSGPLRNSSQREPWMTCRSPRAVCRFQSLRLKPVARDHARRWSRLLGGILHHTRDLIWILLGPGVINHALEIHDDRGFIADDPRIVTRRKQRQISRPALKLGAVIHSDLQHS